MHDAADDSRLASALDRAKAGDAEGLNELLLRCRRYLRIMAECQIGDRLAVKFDESDLVQQTLLEAYRGWEDFAGRSPPELMGWLRRLLGHNAIDAARRHLGEKRDVQREIGWANPPDRSEQRLQFAADASTPSQHLLQAEAELLLSEAIDRLSQDHREVIILRSLRRLPFKEVAEQMGRNVHATQMMWTRAVQQLQREYRKLEGPSQMQQR